MKLELSDGIFNSVKVGDILLCCDYKQFIIVEMPDGQYGVLDIETSKINNAYFSIVGILNYMSEYHLGIHKIIENDNVIIKEVL